MRQTPIQKIQPVRQLTDVVVAVFRLNGILVAWGDGFAAPEGLTSARWQMLGALALAGRPLSAPQVAAGMGVSRQGALKQLNLLAQDGLIEARDNPQHKRSPLFALSVQGERTYGAVDRRWRQHAGRAAAGFSAAELEAALKVLSGLAALHAQAEPGDAA